MNRLPRTLVVNFNGPELNYLAGALAQRGSLSRYVRPYINKGRLWERTLARLPLVGQAYASTFGRRRLDDRRLATLTHEAGILADLGVAAIGRLPAIPLTVRLRASYGLQESVRRTVARAAARHEHDAECAVAHVGFGLPTFEAAKRRGAGKSVLNYSTAHHRQQRAVQREEREREPEFSQTWPAVDDWPAAYEEAIDREVELADCILVGSSYARDSFVREGVTLDKLAIVPYGVDLATFTAEPAHGVREPRRFKAIFAGQLSQRKGLSYLLRAYQKFRKPDTELTLVGNPLGTDAPLRRYADSFRYVPHQTRAALAQLYREADVFVFPTLLEGMGLVVLEAMACGLPVIVTANGPGDVVRDGVDGFVIPCRDEDAICDRLERLYRDSELRAEMGRNAAARARQFDWEAYTTGALTVLTGLAPPVGLTLPAAPSPA